MDYRIKKWKYLGYAVGCVGILINLFFFCGEDTKKDIQYKASLVAINLTATIIWISGITLNKSYLLLPLLLWYTLILGAWIKGVVIYLWTQIEHMGELYFIVVVTVPIVIVYTFSVICFFGFRAAIKRHRLENPTSDVEYTPAPIKNQLHPNNN